MSITIADQTQLSIHWARKELRNGQALLYAAIVKNQNFEFYCSYFPFRLWHLDCHLPRIGLRRAGRINRLIIWIEAQKKRKTKRTLNSSNKKKERLLCRPIVKIWQYTINNSTAVFVYIFSRRELCRNRSGLTRDTHKSIDGGDGRQHKKFE